MVPISDSEAAPVEPISDRAGADQELRYPDFETAYRQRWAPTFRLAYLMTGNRELAEEVAQDAFIGLVRHFHTVDNPAAYLRRSVVNRVIGLNRRARAIHIPLSDNDVAVAGDVPELDETWPRLARLPERQRVALVLRFYEDLDFRQVAQVMGCRTGTVRSLVHRGLQRLRSDSK